MFSIFNCPDALQTQTLASTYMPLIYLEVVLCPTLLQLVRKALYISFSIIKSLHLSYVILGVTNNFMQISVHNNIITCYFPGYYMIGSISCKVVNITDENCEEPLSWSITSENLTHNSTTFVLKLPPNLSAYCLTLSGNNGSSFAVIQDTFVINRGELSTKIYWCSIL